ncbi:MAG: helix-turn-helix transcriptional regulator [Thaumarchaeota archaeon]|nr:helix-turn-helix transcriptional regulator [Nitrososphaerota archaeon]
MSSTATLTAKDVVEQYDGANLICAFTPLLEVLGKPHTMKIVYVLTTASPWRFTQIQKILHIQPKTLAARLQELVEFGLVSRKSYNEIPPRVDYELTQKGRDVTKIFDIMGHLPETGQSTLLQKKIQRA